MRWAVASALAVLGVASSAAGQVVNFTNINDAVSNRCYSAEDSVENVANPNQLQIGLHNGSCAASSGALAPRQVMDTISFFLEAPPGWKISTVHFSQDGSTSSSGTGQAFADVTWVVDDIPESIPMTTSGWSATVDLSEKNLDFVPISITTFLGAAKPGARGSAQATATNPVVTVTLEPNVVGFDDFTLSSYGGFQDATGTVTIEDGGATLRLVGNRWQKIDINYTVTTNTILEFDFRSDAEGDIHLIGFDTDLNISAQRAFKVYGTQNWGIQTYDTYSGGGVTQHFVITVGQHYTGVMPYLFFGMDHDVANPNGESVFSNVQIYEGSTPINFNNFTLSSYGGSQDATGTVSIEDGGATLRLVGNRWQQIDINYTVTTNTILEFDFRSDAEGDIHLIGFDTDLNISAQRTFKVYGTQNWGVPTYDTYSGGGVTQHFVIPVGQHYAGVMPYLFFGMDHDVTNPNGESVFSNVRISEN